MELIYKRLANLLAIKSIITIDLLALFSYAVMSGLVNSEQLNTIVLMVISFYFGTQKRDE